MHMACEICRTRRQQYTLLHMALYEITQRTWLMKIWFQKTVPFTSPTPPLQDIIGPMPSASVGGAKVPSGLLS
jgi:hypothetical protein